MLTQSFYLTTAPTYAPPPPLRHDGTKHMNHHQIRLKPYSHPTKQIIHPHQAPTHLISQIHTADTAYSSHIKMPRCTPPHTARKRYLPRPDIIVADKRKNRITIVEIGITFQNNLVKTEMEKKDKYQDLGKQMKFQTFGNHDTEIVIIPWVMTWDGVVTEFHNSYRRQLGISDRMEAQLQRIVLQQSHNFVLRELGVAATGIT
ncbi:reverse transcriptase domain containing protein [Babesia caballi]|uniref:Reverse transcriptase domain containing protein n=1 Tax=Babesia caballi TaxID=5871 RepID=A0AAV4LW17_BABCB|nr:reverse transcriptase domain containing protein [Babesia caballi]